MKPRGHDPRKATHRGRSSLPGRASRWVLLALLLQVGGCSQETSYDAFLRAQKMEGEAERGACRLVFDRERGAHVISSEDVARCLRENKRALRAYERAAARGYRGEDYDRIVGNLRDRIERLASMERTVGMLEREQASSPSTP